VKKHVQVKVCTYKFLQRVSGLLALTESVDCVEY